MNQLKEMLEAYRNGERGLPTYDELAALAYGANEITPRDYFAAKSLQGASASNVIYNSPQQAAEDAYRMADAMLAERAK